MDLVRTPDLALLMVMKSLLDSAQVPYVVQGEEGLHAFPLRLAGWFFNTSAHAAVIRVREQDYADARTLIEETVPPSSEPDE